MDAATCMDDAHIIMNTQADIQYLDASNTPAMVSEMTNPVAIRGARAVRVIFPLSSEEI